MRNPTTDKQRDYLNRLGVAPALHDILSSKSSGQLMTDLWNRHPSPLNPKENEEDRTIANQLVTFGFKPEHILRMTRHTATSIIEHAPLPKPPNPLKQSKHLILNDPFA